MEQAGKYTDQQYWNRYYKPSSAQREQIEKICSEYDELWEKWIHSCSTPPRTVIEIGAYPGRYIAYFGSKYNLEVTGLDFNSDTEKIKTSMETMGVDNYHLVHADFLKHQPDKKYDLVFSNGFIEHFENYQDVLDLHVPYLNENGALMVMIPNLRYTRKYFGLAVDRANLEMHNLKCMNLGTFKEFAKRNHLHIVHLGYFGGFAYAPHTGDLNLLQKIIAKAFRLIFKNLNPYLRKRPTRWYSCNIIAIFRKE
jgi:2-polyprenyl-3-methyl-5-hydroxy-6-metoxy-1,4-benzoquinol methylase